MVVQCTVLFSTRNSRHSTSIDQNNVTVTRFNRVLACNFPQSINKFITRHSTEASATMSLSQTHRVLSRLSRFLKMFTDGAVQQLSGREFQSLGAATEKRRAAMSMLCRGTERKLCVDDRNERD